MELSVGVESKDENRVTMNSGSPVMDQTNESEVKIVDSKKNEANEPEETMNSFGLAMNIMKGIAGTGCLALPVAVYNVGIIWAVLLFIIVSAGYILGSYQLITTNDHLKDKKILRENVHTNNQYAYLCYVTMGLSGFYIFNMSMIITLFGASAGTIIAMTDFMCKLPFQIGSERVNRGIMQVLLTVIVIILTLLKDPSLLVGVSSMGMISMVASLVILFVYGLCTTSFTFKSSYLYPHSASGFLSNLGLFVHSLAFILFLLSNTKHLKKQYKKHATRTIGVAVVAMALIYAFMGIVFLLLFIDENDNIAQNILVSFPDKNIFGTIVSVFMVITTIGSVPLYMGPICEVVETNFGSMKSGRLFIGNRKMIAFRVIMVGMISFVAFIFPYFSDVLSFNIR